MPEEKPLSDNGFRDMGIFDVDEFLDAIPPLSFGHANLLNKDLG